MPIRLELGSMTKVLESKLRPLVIAAVEVAVEVNDQAPARIVRASASASPMNDEPLDQKLSVMVALVVVEMAIVAKPVKPVVPETAKEERFVPPAVREPEMVALPELEKV